MLFVRWVSGRDRRGWLLLEIEGVLLEGVLGCGRLVVFEVARGLGDALAEVGFAVGNDALADFVHVHA